MDRLHREGDGGAVTGASDSAPAGVSVNPPGRLADDQESDPPRLSVAPNWMAAVVGTWTMADPTTEVAGVPNVAVMPLMLSEYALAAVTVWPIIGGPPARPRSRIRRRSGQRPWP